MPQTEIGSSERLLQELRTWVEHETPTTDPKAVNGLLDNRAQAQGLVERAPHPDDARAVRVLLTHDGEQILTRLSALHRDELRRMNATLALPTWHDDPMTNGATPARGERRDP